ncbi:MAG: 4Fe-4S binding protein [Paramuribaculum sp.]|nr:4Fe-4S binding protein [Paramuribaculum sp.]
MINRLLKICRIAASLIFFFVTTAALTAAPLAIPGVAAWMERIQFLPAVMTFALAIFIGWLIVTLLFGRIYCSSVCPVGTLQDIVAHISRKIRPHNYHYANPSGQVRFAILAVVLVCLIGGFFVIPSILDPYTAYERMCRDLLSPLYASATGSPALLPREMSWWNSVTVKAMTGWSGTSVAILTFVAIAAIAARKGRLLCNTVCPVGTTLGLISRFSIFQIEIDTDKCIQCRKCEYVCKSCCIDMTDHVVDGSRCVNCFDCINVCPNDAIHYTSRRKQLSIPMMQQIKGIGRVPEATLESNGTPSSYKKEINRKNETIS